jgi:hypothetical protein
MDEELVAYYLKRKVHGWKIELEIIPKVDIYKHEPWDLLEKSFLPRKDLEWYIYIYGCVSYIYFFIISVHDI